MLDIVKLSMADEIKSEMYFVLLEYLIKSVLSRLECNGQITQS